jgi:NHLM bacteriocin system ABC transporter peptidase/ATP-binding protein
MRTSLKTIKERLGTTFRGGPAAQQRPRRVRTPTVLQMETVECGAAALAIVLGYFGRRVPLEELRIACGVSRDGSKASNVLKAARGYGLTGKGYRKEPDQLRALRLPLIVFWNFNHFLVVEGFGKGKVYLNDPAAGPRTVTTEEFDEAFTGVVLALEPGPDFKPGGRQQTLAAALRRRLPTGTTALLYLVLVSLLLALPVLVLPTFTRVFVDEYLAAGTPGILGPLLGGMALAAGLIAVLTWLRQRSLLRLETHMALTTSSTFFWHVLRLPVEFFAQRQAGEISTRVAINSRVAQLLAGDVATTLLRALLVVLYLLLMAWYDPFLTAIAVLAAAANLLLLRYIGRKRGDQRQRLEQESAKQMGAAYDGLQLIETLKASGTESDFFARWAGYQAKVVTVEQELGVSGRMLGTLPPLLTAITLALVLTLGGLRVLDGRLTPGSLAAFQLLMLGFMAPINRLMSVAGHVQEAQADMKRLDDVLAYPAELPVALDVAGPAALPRPKLAGYLELKGITFGYSRLDPPLIEDFSLSLKPGARVALVGGSGSGKSTIAKLVAGLYMPWSGEILFDGLPRQAHPRALMLNSLAVVDQDIFLFGGTIKDNLTMWDATVPERAIHQAARDAAIHEEISNRPGGYDYLLEEGGRDLSGGQRQRLEIARALTANPTILVLDEATSALDPITEQAIDDRLRRRGCTCLIVAHRLSTIRDCDEIVVLDRGKVVQRGTHDEMRQIPGPYAALIGADEPPTAERPPVEL